jgi:hypothetical protein
VRVGDILSLESRRKLALLAPYAPCRILGLASEGERHATAAAKPAVRGAPIDHCAAISAAGTQAHPPRTRNIPAATGAGSVAEMARCTVVGASAHCVDTSPGAAAATFASWAPSTSPTLIWRPPPPPAEQWRIRRASEPRRWRTRRHAARLRAPLSATRRWPLSSRRHARGQFRNRL